ncbi:MAG: hypothetical protein HY870_21095 [Chloroflexi bacterium]|nr:hypothetical protein [Chloroflexota bacterium]
MTVRRSPATPPAITNDRHLAILILVVLLLIYLITFSGKLSTIDELALYAMTDSLAQHGTLDTSQILFAAYHNPVGELEPGQAIAALPLYALLQPIASVNSLQAIMLLNPIVTALTAALLFLIGRELDYSPRSSTALALVFGLASLAWPYSRTFLREPLTGCCLTLALLGYFKWRRTRATRWLAMMFSALAATILVKYVSAAVVAFFLLPVAVDWFRTHPRRRGWIIALSSLGLASIIGAGVLFAQARYGASFSLLPYLSGFTLGGVGTTIYGMLLSPGKGLIFYTPVVLAAWWGLAHWPQSRRMILWFCAGVPLIMIAAYGNNSMWYGGQIWGPRFLVPVLPLMLLPLIEVLKRRVVWGLIALSIVAQIGPVTADWALGHRPLNRLQRPWETTIGLDPSYWTLSPPINQLRFWTQDRADVLWAHPQAESPFVFDPVLFFGLAASATSAGLLLARGLRHRTWRIEVGLAAGLACVATALLLSRGWDDAHDAAGLSIDEARSIAQPLSPASGAAHTYVTVSNAFHNYVALGFMKGDFQHYWYSPVEQTNFAAIEHSADRANRLTLTIDRVHLPPDQSATRLRDWLNQRAYQFDGGYIGGYERMAYVWGPTPKTRQPIGLSLADRVEVISGGLGADRFAPGDVIPIELELRKTGSLAEVVVIKTQLSGQGISVSGHDSGLQSGTIDPMAWPPGATVIDRRGLLIPADLAPGEYTLEIGLEVPDGPLLTADGRSFISLGQITVAR